MLVVGARHAFDAFAPCYAFSVSFHQVHQLAKKTGVDFQEQIQELEDKYEQVRQATSHQCFRTPSALKETRVLGRNSREGERCSETNNCSHYCVASELIYEGTISLCRVLLFSLLPLVWERAFSSLALPCVCL